MSDDPFASGDVFWAPDPYNTGGDPRPWLVLAADTLPYRGEEYICAGLTLSDLADNIELRDEHWVVGNNPEKTSYCSPWVVATIKHDAVAEPQGCVTESVTQTVVQQSVEYLSGDVSEI
jgi:hypothetical protein